MINILHQCMTLRIVKNKIKKKRKQGRKPPLNNFLLLFYQKKVKTLTNNFPHKNSKPVKDKSFYLYVTSKHFFNQNTHIQKKKKQKKKKRQNISATTSPIFQLIGIEHLSKVFVQHKQSKLIYIYIWDLLGVFPLVFS
jgi:hypothetical protein